jgi:O6-methylguanine-DNA--protein-cysteine methyltransferase
MTGPVFNGQSFAIFDTAIGPCGIVWGARGITGVQLPMGSRDKTRLRIVQRSGDIPEAEPTPEGRRAIAAIQALLEGEPNDLRDIVLDLEGVPAFHRGVYDIARGIPPGKTLTYGDIARQLGGRTGARGRSGARPQSLSDRGALPSRARGRQQARRLFRQWRRRHQAEDAGDRGRAGQSHPEPVRLSSASR